MNLTILVKTSGLLILVLLNPAVADDTLHASLEFASYIGAGDANNRSVVVDNDGNIYMSGGADDQAWPTTDGSKHQGGGSDVAITKLSPDGKLLWSILLGGPEEDYAYVSAVSDSGELYVSGRAGEGFPTTEGAFDRTFNGGIGRGPHSPTDAFVLKLSRDGKLIYSTYIGGNGDDNGRAIHLLPSGKVIVGGGNTTSTDLPTDQGTLPGPVLKPARGGPRDSWVAVVDADGRSLDFLTYFGANDEPARVGSDIIRALGTDSRGNIWIGGDTFGTDFIPTPDAFYKSRNLQGDSKPASLVDRVLNKFSSKRGHNKHAYIAKLSPDGRRLLYFSWLGGSGNECIETEGVSDAQGNFYVAGCTTSTDFPTSPGAFQTTLRGTSPGNANTRDAFIVKVNDNGSLGFATLFGGSMTDEVFFGPVVDARGRVCATGIFTSTDLPVTEHALQPHKAGAPGSEDSVLACFSADGKRLLYASYFGGSGREIGRHIATGPQDNALHIVGETYSQDLPLKNPVSTEPAAAWVAKFSMFDKTGDTEQKD